MKRWVLGLAACLLMGSLAQAHFVWIVPGANGVHVVFSDTLEPDSADLLEKVKHTECFTCGADGKPAAVKFMQDKDVLKFGEIKESCVVGGVCRYGVLQKGGKEPFLLMYYAKSLVGPSAAAHHKSHDRLALEIAPTKDAGTFQVLWQGKPLPEAELVILTPGKAETSEAKSDKEGRFKVGLSANGIYGVRAKHMENKAGEVDGKKYQSVRHYSTLTFKNDSSK